MDANAKQAFREFVDGLSESDAEHVWDLLRGKLAEEAAAPPLTPEDIAAIKRGLADIEAGRVYSQEECRAHFGLPPR